MTHNAPTVRGLRVRSVINALGAVALATGLVVVSASGAGALPALGPTLSPRTGVWVDARTAAMPTDQRLTVPGITTATTIGFEANGIAHVTAGSDADLFRAVGYLHGRFRIFQMDLMRRQAAGRLSEIFGPDFLKSDRFELDVGLGRAAERDWQVLPADAPARTALVQYADGVNAAIAQMRRDNALPMYFKMIGYTPEPWRPVDSFLVQRLQTQVLALDSTPLPYSYIYAGLGKERFDKWFQVTPQNPQHPYDKGPYKRLPLVDLPQPDPAAPRVAAGDEPASDTQTTRNAPPATSDPSGAAMAAAAGDMLTRMAALPSHAIHTIGNSNEWVVSGSRTASGKPILAVDPHLKLSLPSVWYQLAISSPSYNVAGISLPGIPVVLMGHNQDVSWGIANSQHAGTLYYLEKTDPGRPDQYFWRNEWRQMNTLSYDIKVKGQASQRHTVRLTVHGPVMTLQGITASMWWVGALPSNNIDSMLKLMQATNFQQFRESLRGWGTPAENFAYADRAGNIGIVNAGYAPQVASGSPWLPLDGTGASDVVGTVPFDALPLTYNPPEGVASAANQREVTKDYPYYWGRGQAFFDSGWRVSEIVHGLDGKTGITGEQMSQLQLSLTDGYARALAPTLVAALDPAGMDGTERAAFDQLRGWDFNVTVDSPAPTIWLKFVDLYERGVWDPVWQHYGVSDPPSEFPRRTAQGIAAVDALRGMLVNLTTDSPNDPIFSPPTVGKRTAPDVARQAFRDAVKQLAAERGPDPATWRYGDQHSVLLASVLTNRTLDGGPFPIGSDRFSINSVNSPAQVRDGKTLAGTNVGGASWRYLIDWGTGEALSSYPGGASENAASPWYDNGVADWLAGRYTSMLSGPAAATEGRTWTLVP